MTWRDAHDVRDLAVNEAAFDALAASVQGPVRCIATPVQYIDSFGSWQKGPWALVVGANAVALAKPKLIGAAKVALSIPLTNFAAYRTDLQGGHGPLWELYSKLEPGGSIAFLFDSNAAMEAVASYINSGIAFMRSGLRPQ